MVMDSLVCQMFGGSVDPSSFSLSNLSNALPAIFQLMSMRKVQELPMRKY